MGKLVAMDRMDRNSRNRREPLISKHGGYRKLKSFRVAQLVYDVTVRFCDRYIDKRSRTHDRMVQAARSGVQNIAEGSQASGTSKKFELKLTSVARASLEELRLDYEDFLRHRSLPLWERSESRRADLIGGISGTGYFRGYFRGGISGTDYELVNLGSAGGHRFGRAKASSFMGSSPPPVAKTMYCFPLCM